MALERDEQEERLARIEQMMEQLSRETRQFSDLHRETIGEARRLRERLSASRQGLRNVRVAVRRTLDRVKRTRKASK